MQAQGFGERPRIGIPDGESAALSGLAEPARGPSGDAHVLLFSALSSRPLGDSAGCETTLSKPPTFPVCKMPAGGFPAAWLQSVI